MSQYGETTSRDDATSGTRLKKAQSLLRVIREHQEIQQNINPYWCAAPVNEDDPYEWHFTIRGPMNSEFEGGLYHGRILLPSNYPLTPPSVILLTKNGRFEVGKKVCLSASNYHPELWQPAWGLRTMLDALHAFFPTPADGALHSLNWPKEERQKYAMLSPQWKCPVCEKTNEQLIQSLCTPPSTDRPVLPSEVLLACSAKLCANVASDDNNETECTTHTHTQDEEAGRKTDLHSSVGVGVGAQGEAHDGIAASETEGRENTSATERWLERVRERRRQPEKNTNIVQSLFAIKKPQTLGECFLLTFDLCMLVLAVLSVLLFIDILLSPPTTFIRRI